MTRSAATRAFPSTSILRMMAPSDSSARVLGSFGSGGSSVIGTEDAGATEEAGATEAEPAAAEMASLAAADADGAAEADAEPAAAGACAMALGAPSRTVRSALRPARSAHRTIGPKWPFHD